MDGTLHQHTPRISVYMNCTRMQLILDKCVYMRY